MRRSTSSACLPPSLVRIQSSTILREQPMCCARVAPLRSAAAMNRFWRTGLGLLLALGCGREQVLRVAVIGDFGGDTPEEAQVAALVAGFQPDLVVTVGDNNYPDGAVE